ncbi:unnamed protein product [Linum trigynum]|uniref:Secreted protein n=1 Tax=Linum trigynum TaxID=586398 RepID=A0AAV2CIB5_9ROSI
MKVVILVVVHVWLGSRGRDWGDWDGEVEIGRRRWSIEVWLRVEKHLDGGWGQSKALMVVGGKGIGDVPVATRFLAVIYGGPIYCRLTTAVSGYQILLKSPTDTDIANILRLSVLVNDRRC